MSRRSDAVVWDQSAITREARWRALGSRGATVWFTGLPGSGKSSLAAAVEAHFVGAGRPQSGVLNLHGPISIRMAGCSGVGADGPLS